MLRDAGIALSRRRKKDGNGLGESDIKINHCPKIMAKPIESVISVGSEDHRRAEEKGELPFRVCGVYEERYRLQYRGNHQPK